MALARGSSTRRRHRTRRASRPRGSAPPSPVARTPATCAAMGAGGEQQPGIGQARVPEVRSRRRAPRQRAGRPGGRAARSKALSAPSTAASRHACGRPRRGAVAAVLPHWSHDDGRLPGGRLTLQLPPPASDHRRGAWCERRNGTASARWAPRLPGQPASRLHLQALVRAAFDHFDPDRRGLWVRHADTHAQANSYRPRAHPGRMSAHAAAAAAQRAAGVSVARHEVSLARDRNFGRQDRNFGAKRRWSTVGPPGFSVESAALPGPPPRTFTTK